MGLDAHLDQCQPTNLARLGGNVSRIGHRRGQPPGRARAGLALGGRKGKVAGCFQFPQRLQAAITLGEAARVVEVELLA